MQKIAILGFFLFLFFPYISFAQSTDKINAGLLSDIWFSSLNLEYKKDVTIYTSFQNTSDKVLEGKVQFLIGEVSLGETSFEVQPNSIEKISHMWNVEAGTFDIGVNIQEISMDGQIIDLERLTKSNSTTKIKINRAIDIEYVKEVGAHVFETTIKNINNVAENTNQKLESLKTVSNQTTSNKKGSHDSEVLGMQYQREGDVVQDTTKGSTTNDQQTSQPPVGDIVGIQQVESVEDGTYTGNTATTSNPQSSNALAVSKNMGISFLQFIILYWYFFLPLITILVLWFLFKERD